MNREEIIKYAREVIEFNKTVRDKNNNALNAAIGLIEKHDGEYERGANDAWELAGKIIGSDDNDYSVFFEPYKIFGCCHTDIFSLYTASDALGVYKDWLKKKEEEAAKPKLGDVVEVRYLFNDVIERGILLATGDTGFNYLSTGGILTKASYCSGVELKKTGEHVDIQGMLDKIG